MKNIISNHWIFGVGPGNLPYFHNRYCEMKQFLLTYANWYPNNEFLQIIGETGIFSLIIWLSFFVSLFIKTIKLKNNRTLINFKMMYLITFAGQLLYLNFGFFTQTSHFWIVIGIICGMYNLNTTFCKKIQYEK